MVQYIIMLSKPALKNLFLTYIWQNLLQLYFQKIRAQLHFDRNEQNNKYHNNHLNTLLLKGIDFSTYKNMYSLTIGRMLQKCITSFIQILQKIWQDDP